MVHKKTGSWASSVANPVARDISLAAEVQMVYTEDGEPESLSEEIYTMPAQARQTDWHGSDCASKL